MSQTEEKKKMKETNGKEMFFSSLIPVMAFTSIDLKN